MGTRTEAQTFWPRSRMDDRSILVPLDGSKGSECAMPLAIRVAREIGAELTLARVHVPPAPLSELHAVGMDARQNQQIRDLELRQLTLLAARTTRHAGVQTHAIVLEGDVGGQLLRFAAQTEADLIVMATHRRGTLVRVFLGSVADELVRTASRPLLLCSRTEQSWSDADGPPFQHVLVTLDGTARAESVLSAALQLGGREAHYSLLRVVDLHDVLGVAYYATSVLRDPALESTRRAQARAGLQVVAERLRADGFDVSTHVSVEATPHEAIIHYARQRTVDLIALATHGQGGVGRWFRGSTAEKVLTHCEHPVLLTRAAG
jgi:nucleotide-binding universal stress UspA family protein